MAKSKGEVTTLQVQIIKTDTNLRIKNNMSEKRKQIMKIADGHERCGGEGKSWRTFSTSSRKRFNIPSDP